MVPALIAIDAAGGALLRFAYGRSTANPIYRPVAAGMKTLVVGSSTSKRGFDPAALWEGTYNSAEDGQGIFFVAAFMRNLPPASGIRRVIFGVDPDDIVSGFQSNNTRHLKRLAPFAIDDTKLRTQLRRHDPYIEIKYLSGLYPFRGDAPAIFLEWAMPRTSGTGYEPLTRTLSDVPAWKPTGAAPPPPADEAIDALRDIVAAARSRSIHLIAAVTPLAGGHRREFDPHFTVAMGAARAILAEGRVCDLTSIHDEEIDRIARSNMLFHDGPHLNIAGARRYTIRIRELIEKHCAWTLPD